jgi:hypothetical protein
MLSRKDVAAQQVKVVLSPRERNHLAERDVYDDRLASAKRFCRRWFRRGAPSLTLLAKPGAEFPNFRKMASRKEVVENTSILAPAFGNSESFCGPLAKKNRGSFSPTRNGAIQ